MLLFHIGGGPGEEEEGEDGAEGDGEEQEAEAVYRAVQRRRDRPTLLISSVGKSNSD